MSTYPSLDAYNADVVAARDAYQADQAVAEGLCATCQTNKRDGHMRQCWTCRHGGRQWAAKRMRAYRAKRATDRGAA